MRKSTEFGGKAGRTLRLGMLMLTATSALAACTTVEGTNAFVDPVTFEREVMRPTLQGVGLVPAEEKAPLTGERSPLVMPSSGTTAPPPTQSSASIPEDSDDVVVDTASLTTADLQALRTGTVVSSAAPSGRPLTEAEARELAARSAVLSGSQRNIYLPPAEYFQTVNGQQMICQAANGQLVAITDPSCPADVRAALAARQ